MHRVPHWLHTINLFIEKRPTVAFCILSLLVFLWQGYAHVLLLGPQSLHFIRQTDSLAFFLRFYQDGSSLFEPAVLNLLSEQGKVASEFPILYYISAGIAHVTGFHPAILRILHFLIIFTGLACLFKMQLRLLGSFLMAFGGTWLAFSSILFFYYAGNFLPDIPALGLSLCGWYFFSLFLQSGSWKHLCGYNLLFLLSGLLKVTFLINALAVPIVILLFIGSGDYFGALNKKQLLLRTTLSLILTLALCSAWYIYARHYNQLANDTYFLVKARPFWQMSKEDILITWEYFSSYWFFAYYHPYLWITFALLGLYSIARFFHSSGLFSKIYPVLLLGSFCILMLFFNQFRDHDYYFIVFLPFFVFLVLAALLNLKQQFPRLYGSMIIKALLIYMVYFGMSYARQGVAVRLRAPDRMADAVSPLKTYKDSIDQFGFQPSDNVLILGDMSTDGGLYHLRRKGIPMVDTTSYSAESVKNLILKNDLRIAISLREHEYGRLADTFGLEPLIENDSIRVYRIGINDNR